MGLELARPAQAHRKPRRRIVVPDSVHAVCDVYAHQQAALIRLAATSPPKAGGLSSKLALWEDGTIHQSVADRRLHGATPVDRPLPVAIDRGVNPQ